MIFNIDKSNLTSVAGLESLVRSIQDEDYGAISRTIDAHPTIVNFVDFEGHTPLHWVSAMIGDNADIAELLVVRGVDVNARDYDGLTAADWARLITNVGIAEMLSEI